MSPCTWMRWRKVLKVSWYSAPQAAITFSWAGPKCSTWDWICGRRLPIGLQHVVALGQLALEAEHRQGVAQRFALQGAGVALQGADQGAVAFTQVEVVTAIDFQGVLGVANQQAAEHAGQAGLADLAGLGDLVHQHCGEEYPAEGGQLLLESGSCRRPAPGLGDFNHAAAQAHFAIVEHHGLARRDGALRVIERGAVAVGGFFQGAGLVALAIAHLGGQAAAGCSGRSG